MRAPFQILALPYKYQNGIPMYCVLHRSDYDQWQFIAGGGEDKETPKDAAKREIIEEGGVAVDHIISLKSMCHIPVEIFPRRHLYGWSDDMYVIPEYSFGFECTDELVLSHEHTELVWLPYKEARERLQWDSNKTALYELNCILSKQPDKCSLTAKPPFTQGRLFYVHLCLVNFPDKHCICRHKCKNTAYLF